MERSRPKTQIDDESLAWDMAYAEKPYRDESRELLRNEIEKTAFEFQAVYGDPPKEAVSNAKWYVQYGKDPDNPYHRIDLHLAALASGKVAYKQGNLNDEAVAHAAQYYLGRRESDRLSHDRELEEADKVIAWRKMRDAHRES